MTSEGERLARELVWENITKLDWRDQKKVVSVESQFKIAYYVFKRFKYRPWFTNLTYKFYEYYRYDMYWMEYMLWLKKKGFLDFVPPNDLQDHSKKFIINGLITKGSPELFAEFMSEKAACRVGGIKEKTNWGGIELEIERTGRTFYPPKRRFRKRPKKRNEDKTEPTIPLVLEPKTE